MCVINAGAFIMRNKRRALRTARLVLFALLANILRSSAQTDDYYCGTSFLEAGEACIVPCPSGEDADCVTALGPEYGCFFFTGCKSKIDNGFVPAPLPTDAPTPAPTAAVAQTYAPTLSAMPSDPPSSNPTALALVTEPPTVATSVETSSPIASESNSPTAATQIETSIPISASFVPTPSPQVQSESVTIKPTRRTKRPTPPPMGSSLPSSLDSVQDQVINTNDSFCGTSYFQAVQECSAPCELGNDDDCTAIGEGYTCFPYTGCTSSTSTASNATEAGVSEPTTQPTSVQENVPLSQEELYIVLTLQNTADRNMTDMEEQKLIDELQDLFSYFSYYQGKWGWSAEKIEVWYQQQSKQRRIMQENIAFEGIATSTITLILDTVWQGGFTASEIGGAIAELIEMNQDQLISALQGQNEFPFFFSVDQIQSKSIEQITMPPVAAPAPETPLVDQSTSISTDGGSTGATIGGIVAGAFVLCFVGIVSSYFLAKKHFSVTEKTSERTLEVEDVEFGKTANATNLELPPGTNNESGDLNSSSSSSGSASMVSHSSSDEEIAFDGSTPGDNKVDIESPQMSQDIISMDSREEESPISSGPPQLSPSPSSSSSESSVGSSSSSSSSSLDGETQRKIEQRRAARKNDASKNWNRIKGSVDAASKLKNNQSPNVVRDDEQPSKMKSRGSDIDLTRLDKSDSLNTDEPQKKSKWKSLKARDVAKLSRSVPNQEASQGISDDRMEKRRKGMPDSFDHGEIIPVTDERDAAAAVKSKSKDNKNRMEKRRKSMPDSFDHEEIIPLTDKREEDAAAAVKSKSKDNWKKIRASMTTEEITSSDDRKQQSSAAQDSSDYVDPSVKSKSKDNWKSLRNSIAMGEVAMTYDPKRQSSRAKRNSEDGEALVSKSKSKDNWKSLRNSIAMGENPSTDDKKRQPSRARDNPNDAARIKSKDNWKSLRNSIAMGEIPSTDDKEMREARSRDRSGDTLAAKSKSKDNWKSLRNSIATGESTPQDVRTKDHWKTLSKSLKEGNEIKRKQSRADDTGDELRKSKEHSTDELNRPKDHWKSLSKSIKEDAEVRRPRSRVKDGGDEFRKSRRHTVDELDNPKDHWKSLSKSIKEDAEVKRSQSRAKGTGDEFRKSKRGSAGDLARSRTRDSSDNLRRSSNNELSDDLRKSKRRDADSNLRKSTRRTSGDITRSSRTKGSSGDLRKSTRASKTNDDLRKSKRGNDDLRKSKRNT